MVPYFPTRVFLLRRVCNINAYIPKVYPLHKGVTEIKMLVYLETSAVLTGTKAVTVVLPYQMSEPIMKTLPTGEGAGLWVCVGAWGLHVRG